MRDLLYTALVFAILMAGITAIAIPLGYLMQMTSKYQTGQTMSASEMPDPPHWNGN